MSNCCCCDSVVASRECCVGNNGHPPACQHAYKASKFRGTYSEKSAKAKIWWSVLILSSTDDNCWMNFSLSEDGTGWRKYGSVVPLSSRNERPSCLIEIWFCFMKLIILHWIVLFCLIYETNSNNFVWVHQTTLHTLSEWITHALLE